MNDPELPPLEPSLADLLRAEKTRPGPDSASQEAVWSRLAKRLPSGPGPGGAPPDSGPPAGDAPGPVAPVRTAPPAGGPLTLVGSRAVAALVAMFVAGSVAGGAVVSLLQRPSPATATLESPPPSVPVARAVASASLPETTVAAEPPSAAPVGSLSPAPSSAPSRPALLSPSASATAAPKGTASAGHDIDLAAERSLLDEARAALARGEGERCLTTLARHQKEYPAGRLSLEREVLTIQALAVSGRRAEAVRRAEAFRAAHPNSLLWPAVEAAVGSIP